MEMVHQQIVMKAHNQQTPKNHLKDLQHQIKKVDPRQYQDNLLKVRQQQLVEFRRVALNCNS